MNLPRRSSLVRTSALRCNCLRSDGFLYGQPTSCTLVLLSAGNEPLPLIYHSKAALGAGPAAVMTVV